MSYILMGFGFGAGVMISATAICIIGAVVCTQAPVIKWLINVAKKIEDNCGIE